VRFERLELRNFRGVAEASVSFASSGVTLVTGPNEAGKSTLVEAIELLLELQATSGHQRVRSAQPKGQDAGPEVTMELAFGDVRMTYAKRWLVQPQTTLHVERPDGRREDLTGREAHERAEELLGAQVDLALWRAVRLGQGEALILPSFGTAPSLVHALDMAAGGSGGVDDTLLEQAEAELRRYRTASKQRRPTGELAEAMDAEIAAKARLAEAEEAYERTRDASAAIERDERELESLGRLLIERAALAEDAKAALVERRAAEEADRAADQAATTAQAELDQATQRLRARLDLSARLERLATALAKLEEEVERASVESERTAQAHEVAERELASATERRRAQEAKLRSLERAERRLELTRREQELAARLERAEQAEADRDQAEAELGALTIDESSLERIRRAQAAAEQARIRHEAASPTVVVEAETPLVLHVDGHELFLGAEERWEQVTPDGLVIDLPDHARISVHPGATATGEALATAERALSQVLDAGGVSSVEEAEERARRRRDVLQRLEAARARAEEATRPEPSTEALRQALGQARAELGVLNQAGADEATLSPATPEALRQAIAMAETEVNESRLAESSAEALARALLEAAQAAAHARSEREGERRNQAREAERARAELALERTATPDEALREAVRAAQRRRDDAGTQAAQAKARLSETDPLAAEKAEQAAVALEETRRRKTALEATLATERQHLQHELHDGNAEARTEAERTAMLAEQHRARVERRAAAAALLVETLHRHRDRAQRRYRQPLANQLQRWARTVLDDPIDAVELDATLGLESLTRRDLTLPVSSLSAGTREQLGLLLRLAAATLAAPEGGVPVILDDALGYSDAARVNGLLTVLALAARQLQVIVLTAHPERYAGLDATRVELARRRTKAPAYAQTYEVPSPISNDDSEPPLPTLAPKRTGDPAERILACLASAGVSLGRRELCEQTGIDERAWTNAIHALIAQGFVVQEGHKRGTRYRLATDRP